MKRLAMLAVVAIHALPAWAGQGFIEETETGFYVEYTGDARDKAAAPRESPAADSRRQAAAATTSAPAAAASEDDRARREANEARAEARRAESESRGRAPARSRRSRQIPVAGANDE